MSFCCGASMLGTTGTLKTGHTMIHRVPILLCPVCFRVEVHHLIRNEYEILAEFALADGAGELDFQEYVNCDKYPQIFENCINTENEDPLFVVSTQINMALDLMAIAKNTKDDDWLEQLGKRLKALSTRKEKILRKRLRK
jgi:hypothetical protein